MTALPDTLEGLLIRYRTGLGRTNTGRCVHDRGKSIDVDTGHPKTVPVKRAHVEAVLPDPKPYEGPGLTRQPSYARPEQGVHDVGEVAEAVRPAKDRKRVGDSVGRRFHRWLRDNHHCQWCGRYGTDVDHWPSRAAGGDDLLCHLLCHPCHMRRHDTGALPGMTPEQTREWMRDTQRQNMTGFIRAELEAA